MGTSKDNLQEKIDKLQEENLKLKSIIEDYKELADIFEIDSNLDTKKLAMFLLSKGNKHIFVYFYANGKDYKIDDYFIDDSDDLIFELKEI